MSVKNEKTIAESAARSGMSEKTARKYLKLHELPSELSKPHTWRTRKDPILGIWEEAKSYLKENPGLEAKTLFTHLQQQHAGIYGNELLRTFQRRVKTWRATEGPEQEVIFPQEHYAGELGAFDFTHMDNLGITIQGTLFRHLLFHFILTYSNWETGHICYSESLESVLEGLQKSLWALGGVPKRLRSDNLTAAVYKELNKKQFTQRYQELLSHYGLEGRPINAGKPNENGDVEQSHNRFKKAVEQSLLIRGSRDFKSIDEYNKFLKKIFSQLNAGRKKRFREEQEKLHSLPAYKLDNFKEEYRRVSRSSTINIAHNVYSVHSRLIGEIVKVRLHADTIEIYYGHKKIDEFQRLRGIKQHKIDYRHIIKSLGRKPGAFEHYKYKSSLFPTVQFRMAYDYFKKHTPSRSSKNYIALLQLAADEGENAVDSVLRYLFKRNADLSLSVIQEKLKTTVCELEDVKIANMDINIYDSLLSSTEVLYG